MEAGESAAADHGRTYNLRNHAVGADEQRILLQIVEEADQAAAAVETVAIMEQRRGEASDLLARRRREDAEAVEAQHTALWHWLTPATLAMERTAPGQNSRLAPAVAQLPWPPLSPRLPFHANQGLRLGHRHVSSSCCCCCCCIPVPADPADPAANRRVVACLAVGVMCCLSGLLLYWGIYMAFKIQASQDVDDVTDDGGSSAGGSGSGVWAAEYRDTERMYLQVWAVFMSCLGCCVLASKVYCSHIRGSVKQVGAGIKCQGRCSDGYDISSIADKCDCGVFWAVVCCMLFVSLLIGVITSSFWSTPLDQEVPATNRFG